METINPTQSLSTPPVDPMDKLSPAPDAQTPPVSPVANPYDQVENIKVKGKPKGRLIVLFGILAILLLLIGSSAFLALVAYGKIDINNRELERKISFAIQELPYTPKTAEFLIYKSIEAQENLKSAYIDASIALTGSEATAIPGLGSSFDLKITGPIDFNDKENPEAEVNIKMTPELDADFIAINDKLFFKINEIPAVVKGFVSGAGYSIDPFLTKWIVYDLKSLESDARDTLNEDKTVRDEEQLERIKTALLNSTAINKIVVTETDLDGVSVYQLTLELSSEEYMEFLNEISRAVDPEAYGDQIAMGTTSSQSFENLKITTYVEKESMHTVRSMISFRLKTSEIEVPSQVLGASTIQYFPNIYAQAVTPEEEYMDVAVVVNGSRFNEDFEITEPAEATPIETIIEMYTQQMMQQYEEENSMQFDEEYDGFGDPAIEEEDTGIAPF